MLKRFQLATLGALIVIIAIGFYVRQYNLYTWPRVGATFDEYAWTWQGMNLIQKGVPISWSPHGAYENAEIVKYHDAYFRIVTPFLEHPPVFGLVAGSFAILNGTNDMFELSIQKIRPLALILGLLSIVFLFLYTKEYFDKKVALLASLLYATVPTIAVGSRIVQNENFFIPLWLLGLYLVEKSLKHAKIFLFVILIAMLLPLAKVPFIAGSLSFAALYFYYQKPKRALLIIGFAVIGLIIYVLYGMFFDAKLFFELMKLQTQRYDLVYNSIFALFEKPFGVDRPYTDGWILFGWFSMILLSLQNFKKTAPVIIPFLAYFGIFMAGIPDEPGHGWYRYPLYPFLVTAISIVFWRYYAKNYIVTFLLLAFIGTSIYQNVIFQKIGFSFLFFRLSILLWAITLLPLFFKDIKFALASKSISYVFFSFYILLNIYACKYYNEQ